MTVPYTSSSSSPSKGWGHVLFLRVLMYAMRLSVHCTLVQYTVQYSILNYTLYSVWSFRMRTLMKMLMSKLESLSLGKALLARMAIITISIFITGQCENTSLSAFKQSNNPLLIQILYKFRRLAGGGIRGGGIASLLPTLATAL